MSYTYQCREISDFMQLLPHFNKANCFLESRLESLNVMTPSQNSERWQQVSNPVI